MLQTVCIKLSDEGFYSVWTCPGAASHIGNNHFIHIWKLFSLPVSTSKPDSFNPQAIRYMFKQRSFSFSFFFSRHGNKFCCVYYGWPLYFNIFLVAWRKKGFPFNTILIYCEKIQQHHSSQREKEKSQIKAKPHWVWCQQKPCHSFPRRTKKMCWHRLGNTFPRDPPWLSSPGKRTFPVYKPKANTYPGPPIDPTALRALLTNTTLYLTCAVSLLWTSAQCCWSRKAVSSLGSTAWPTDILKSDQIITKETVWCWGDALNGLITHRIAIVLERTSAFEG